MSKATFSSDISRFGLFVEFSVHHGPSPISTCQARARASLHIKALQCENESDTNGERRQKYKETGPQRSEATQGSCSQSSAVIATPT